jgi:hypothetical protein
MVELKLCDRCGEPEAQETEWVDLVTKYVGLICPKCRDEARAFFAPLPQVAGGTVKGLASLEYLVDDQA